MDISQVKKEDNSIQDWNKKKKLLSFSKKHIYHNYFIGSFHLQKNHSIKYR